MMPRFISLLIYVALPVAGILWWGWDWRAILVLYWLENVTTGVLNVVSMARAPQQQAEGGRPMSMTLNGREQLTSRTGMILFFCAHYGIFTVVHGVFVLVLCTGFFGLGGVILERSASSVPLSPDAFGDGPLGLGGINWLGICSPGSSAAPCSSCSAA